MADVEGGPGFDGDAKRFEGTREKVLELLGAHPITLDLQLFFRISFVVNVIRQIAENKIGRLAGHKTSEAPPQTDEMYFLYL